jgi:hypothetical protein
MAQRLALITNVDKLADLLLIRKSIFWNVVRHCITNLLMINFLW